MTSMIPALALAAFLASPAPRPASATAGGLVSLRLEAGSCDAIGSVIRVDLIATAEGPGNPGIAAIDAILQWDPAKMLLIGSDTLSAGYPWLVTGFLLDPDGINTSIVDGDALFTALASPALPAFATAPHGLVVASILFQPLVALPQGSCVSLVANMGTFGETAVYPSATPGATITGSISQPGCVYTCPIGVTSCSPANPNSTGLSGQMYTSGTASVAQNNMLLEARFLPNNKFGYFLTSPATAFIANPGGSQGNLCLGSPIGRIVGGAIFNTGLVGTGFGSVNVQSMPLSSGPVVIQPGQTWYLQAWYRDNNPAATSNFTDVIGVTFF